MKQKDEKWALFWCDLLHPVLFDDVEPEAIQEFLKELSGKEMVFPGGRVGKTSLSTLRRKLNLYRTEGFDALARKTSHRNSVTLLHVVFRTSFAPDQI